LVSHATERGVDFRLPPDNVVIDKSLPGTREPRTCSVREIKPVEAGLDIGPDTIDQYARKLRGASTILWNGPMGVFEQPPFDRGTRAIAEAVASANATTIVGGGDSVAAIIEAGVADRITHVCTGGGASLEFLAGKVLPGVAALNDK